MAVNQFIIYFAHTWWSRVHFGTFSTFACNVKSFTTALTKNGGILLDISEKVCITMFFEDVICDAFNYCHTMCFSLFTLTSIYSIHKITKIRNSETLNKMEGDTEDSTVQCSKDREIELISRKVSRKRKGIQKMILSDTQCESNINTAPEELVSSHQKI